MNRCLSCGIFLRVLEDDKRGGTIPELQLGLHYVVIATSRGWLNEIILQNSCYQTYCRNMHFPLRVMFLGTTVSRRVTFMA